MQGDINVPADQQMTVEPKENGPGFRFLIYNRWRDVVVAKRNAKRTGVVIAVEDSLRLNFTETILR